MELDLREVTLWEACAWLTEQGYTEDPAEIMNGAQNSGEYCFLYVSDDYYGHNLRYCREYYYCLNYYDDMCSMMGDVGVIFCGGMYTAIGIFHHGQPITKEHIRNMGHSVPLGSQVCCSYESEHESESDPEL